MLRMHYVNRLALVGALLLATSAWAADNKEDMPLRKSQLQVRKLQQEKTALEAKLAALEQDKAAIAKDADALSGKLNGALARARTEGSKQQALQAALDTANEEKASLLARRVELEAQLAAAASRQAATERELASAQSQRKQLEATLQGSERQTAQCEDKNLQLYRYGREVIEQCRDRNVLGTALRLEPFTGIKKVELENTLEQYRDKLDAEKIQPAAASN